MRRTEKNTNKIKGVFLQSLSSVGDVNTFQKAWRGGIITQINLGVIDCYSLVTSSLECSPHLHMLGFGHLFTKDIVCPWEVVKIFSLSISSFCFYGSRFFKKKRRKEKKKKRVSSKKATFSTELTHKKTMCRYSCSKKAQCEKLPNSSSAVYFFRSCISFVMLLCKVKADHFTVAINNPYLLLPSFSPVSVKNVPCLDYHLEDRYFVLYPGVSSILRVMN